MGLSTPELPSPRSAATGESDPGGRVVMLRGQLPGRRRDRRGGPRRLARLTVRAALGMAVLLLLAVIVPVPFLDPYLSRTAREQVAAQLAMPGAGVPEVTFGGGRLLPQLLQGTLGEIRVAVPDVAIGGAQHARFEATLRGVTPGDAGRSHAGEVEASITVPFASLPRTPGQPLSTFSRGPDGSLIVNVPDPGRTPNVIATAFVKLSVEGEAVRAVPQGLSLFGQMLPPGRAEKLTGGTRTQPLPHLPAGLAYQSIIPEPDGLHVALGGVVTTPLTALPTNVGGRAVSYTAEAGLLGIVTAVALPPVISVPLTIFVQPQLGPGQLTLVPRTVRLLGRDRPPGDPLAQIVLSQVQQRDLTRPLPALPAGVTYRSVSVDTQGVKVAVAGVTVRPFSVVSGGPPGGTYGASNGLLTATYHGPPRTAGPLPIIMTARPGITDGVLHLDPQGFVILGTSFPAAAVLEQVQLPVLRYPLQALPPHLSYTGAEVLPDALRIRVSGRDVELTKGLLGAAPAAR